MMESSWLSLITVFAYQMPILIIWLIGACFAIARWQRHPRVSIFVLCACALSVGAILFQAVGQVVLVRMLDMDHVGRVFMIMGIVSAASHLPCGNLIGWVVSGRFHVSRNP